MEARENIKIGLEDHKGKEVVTLRFKYNNGINSKVKKISGARWSRTMKCWYVPKERFNLNPVFEQLKPFAYIDYSELRKKRVVKPVEKKPIPKANGTKEKVEIPQAYKNILVQKRYAENTHKTYINYFEEFVLYFKGRDLEKITKEEINNYILELIRERAISPSQQNQRINAIKFYYEKVLGRTNEYYDIERPLKEKKLPDVLSKEEIKKMIEVATNKKHQTIIAIMYSCGLRRSEVTDLLIVDVDTKRMLIKIRGAKGKKDRYIPLPKRIIPHLRSYYKEYKPTQYLFNGQQKPQYTASSIVKLVQKTAEKAGIKRRVYPHILRHSFATHHLEQGTDLRYIQEWLGHGSTKTTEVYTHITESAFKNFKNPIDDII